LPFPNVIENHETIGIAHGTLVGSFAFFRINRKRLLTFSIQNIVLPGLHAFSLIMVFASPKGALMFAP
jgi:hypothetical protein